MVDYPRIAFVTGPSLDADERLDLNPHGYRSPGFSIGGPRFLGDPDAIAPELGLRQVTLSFFADSQQQGEAWSRAMGSTLARELMRSRNWLLFQLRADAPPAWFKTYPSTGELAFDWVFSEGENNIWRYDLTIDADPGIWGAEESFSATVTNDPSDGGCFAVLPDIKGDLPAPLAILVGGADSADLAPMVSISHGSPAPTLVVIECESAAEISGDASVVVSAGYSNGSGILTEAPSNSADFPLSFTPDAPGSWAVFLRCFGTGTAQLMVGGTTHEPVSLEGAGSGFIYLYLGKLAAPRGLGASSKRPISGAVALGVSVVSDSAFACDCLVLVPLADATSEREANLMVAGNVVGDLTYVDPFLGVGAVYAVDSSGDTTAAVTLPSIAGAFPTVTPGYDNELHFFPCARLGGVGSNEGDDITHEVTLTCTYQPQNLFLPGG